MINATGVVVHTNLGRAPLAAEALDAVVDVAAGYSSLEYDLDAGTVEFSEDAIIKEGGNRISSSYLLYNIIEQRINAQSSGEGDEKVKITVIPENAEEQLSRGDELP